jgi:uncharacterized membrane protein YphA (DoxX/SURF4 family)
MNNPASFLILIFLAVTFIQSAYDKMFDWERHVNFFKIHFSKTSLLKNFVVPSLISLVALELCTGVLTLVGCAELIVNGGRTFGFYGAFLSSITLILMLFAQRLAKDYEGARAIAIYFIPSVLAVYWLN